MMFELPWEKDGLGNKAIYKEKRTFRIGLGLSQSFALSKMTEIDAITAVFGEQRRSFYPSVWILFESSDKMEFFGLYSREPFYELDHTQWSPNLFPEELPVAFLRKGIWIKSIERQAYKNATTPEEYIREHLLGKNHVVFNNTFLDYENATPFFDLALKIAYRLEQGIKVDKADKCELYKPYLEYIRLHFANGCMDYNFNYNVFAYKSEELENWGQKWREQFERVEIDSEVIPNGLKISYKSSILNYFHKFRPYFTNVTYDEVT